MKSEEVSKAVLEYLQWLKNYKRATGVMNLQARRKTRTGLWAPYGVDLNRLLGEKAGELLGAKYLPFKLREAKIKEGLFIKKEEKHVFLNSLKPLSEVLQISEKLFPSIKSELKIPPVVVMLPAYLFTKIPHETGSGLSGGGPLPSIEELREKVVEEGTVKEWQDAFELTSSDAYRVGKWRIKGLKSLLNFLLKCKEDDSEELLSSDSFKLYLKRNYPPQISMVIDRVATPWKRGNRRRHFFKELLSSPLGRKIFDEIVLPLIDQGGRGEGIKECFLSAPEGVILPSLHSKLFNMKRENRIWIIHLLGEKQSRESLTLIKKFAEYSMDDEERKAAEEAILKIEGG